MANRINIVISADDKASKPIRDVSDQMDRSSGSSNRFGSALASLGSTIAHTTVAATALAAGAGAAGVAIGFGFNSSVEQAEAKLNAFMKDNEHVAKTLAWVKEEAALTQFSFTEMADAAANLTPMAKSSGVALEDLIKQAEILAALNPAEGLEGATFSLREALSGDWVSIVERFNLPRKRINELKEQGVPAMQVISRTLNEMGIDYSLVAKQGQTVAARFDQVKDKLTMMAGAAAKPIFDRVSRELDTLGSFNYAAVGEQLKDLTQNILGTFDLLRTGEFKDGMFAGWLQKDAPYISFLQDLRSTAIGVFKFLQPGFREIGDSINKHLVPGAQAFVKSEFVRVISTSLVVAVRAASWTLAELIKFVGEFVKQTSSATGILVGLTAGVVGYAVVVRAITIATVAWTAAQNLLNAAVKANPLGLLVGLIAGVASAYVAASAQTDRMRNATERIETARRNLKTATDELAAAEGRLGDAQLIAEGAALAVERAQLAHNEAVAQYGPTSLEAREAAYSLKRAQDDLASSNRSVADTTREVSEAQKARNDAKDAEVKANAESGASANAAAGQYASLRDRINEANDAMKKGDIKANVKATTSVQNFMPKRSIGTNYAPGGSTLVGEHGPEVVNLPAGSRVSPAWKSRADTASDSAGGTTIQINGNVILQTAQAVDAFFKQQDQAQRFARMGMAA